MQLSVHQSFMDELFCICMLLVLLSHITKALFLMLASNLSSACYTSLIHASKPVTLFLLKYLFVLWTICLIGLSVIVYFLDFWYSSFSLWHSCCCLCSLLLFFVVSYTFSFWHFHESYAKWITVFVSIVSQSLEDFVFVLCTYCFCSSAHPVKRNPCLNSSHPMIVSCCRVCCSLYLNVKLSCSLQWWSSVMPIYLF